MHFKISMMSNSRAHIQIPFLLIALMTVQWGFACSDNNNENISNDEKTQQTVVTFTSIREVILKTGTNDDVVWKINEVRRVNKYYSESLELVNEDAIYIGGEAASKCGSDCRFFEEDDYTFELTDRSGNIYSLEMTASELYDTGIVFYAYFSLKEGNPSAINTNSWADFIIQDVVPINWNKPDHQVNLSSFNEAI